MVVISRLGRCWAKVKELLFSLYNEEELFLIRRASERLHSCMESCARVSKLRKQKSVQIQNSVWKAQHHMNCFLLEQSKSLISPMKDMEAASGHHDFEIQTDLLMAIHSQRKISSILSWFADKTVTNATVKLRNIANGRAKKSYAEVSARDKHMENRARSSNLLQQPAFLDVSQNDCKDT
ncbi:hypothetical protein Mp_4g16820 [Marchantia polymorpha subsp. ruderalis]|uniref:Uncharacterized protein n=2 Tax=Marchantia polymorpha TaxID=3197 RepID=A0AAF6BAM5_MARPO|nr:hypothetical protein MARPO_0148s0038 [Marchantia polymorpha]BBN09059.1 hypothetical protein Mp_4g16820 [Marchantia polymorpha subsp. ruderalis]|eukprot:PTQ29095.1 hypothetical protein MARPO_0148s0038 [Marchantia polymorpha]